nr:HNH endonuclease [Nanchangia anserum]
MSFTADHVHELAKGGHLLGELKPAHRSCNSRRSNRTTPRKRQPLHTTQKW